MTPSQEAKTFAAANGFSIEPVGRRYCIKRSMSPRCLEVVAEVGGYPAALNAMRKWLDDTAPVQMCAGGTLVLPEPSADPALTATANNFFGALEPITPDTVPMSREEMFAPVKAELDRPNAFRQPDPETFYPHKIEPISKLSDFVPERLTNYELDKAAIREYVNADFNDFNAASQARIRNAASRIAKHARKLSGKPPGGPWHVIFNGSTVMKHGYPSRTTAIVVVRWGFNHADPRINDNWRTAAVTVEYRP